MSGFKYLEMVGIVIVSSWIWGAPSVGKSPILLTIFPLRLVLCCVPVIGLYIGLRIFVLKV